jgi:hypothetical protein
VHNDAIGNNLDVSGRRRASGKWQAGRRIRVAGVTVAAKLVILAAKMT